jgi:hypothetical protein
MLKQQAIGSRRAATFMYQPGRQIVIRACWILDALAVDHRIEGPLQHDRRQCLAVLVQAVVGAFAEFHIGRVGPLAEDIAFNVGETDSAIGIGHVLPVQGRVVGD